MRDPEQEGRRRRGEEEGWRSGGDEEFAFTLVLIEPMLWSRFFIHDGHISTSVHVDGPEPGDLVVVTAQAVAADRGPSHDHGPGRGVGAYPLLWGCVQISSASEDF